MITFDNVLDIISDVFLECSEESLKELGEIYVNRDLNSRIRLIVDEELVNKNTAKETLNNIAEKLSSRLRNHTYSNNNIVLYESNLDNALIGASSFPLPGFPKILVLDRLSTETDWANVLPQANKESAPRIVFFSIKGGVGRSTALAAIAWSLAQNNKRVLVVDLDLESPGLSSNLLPEDRRPTYGVTDWLVEDLVDNGDEILDDLIASSILSRDGEIYVVPAHGKDPGDYVSKLGRVWMGKRKNGITEPWSKRLNRLLANLEKKIDPDVILIDSRAGIDDVAASAVTQLGAALVLLFTIDGSQTWTGYKILFQHWNRAEKAKDIRNRLQFVGAMLPDGESAKLYFEGLREQAWTVFSELYDEIPPGKTITDLFNYDEKDVFAPHYPWPIKWHRSFATLQSLHAYLDEVDEAAVESIFGTLVRNVGELVDNSGDEHD